MVVTLSNAAKVILARFEAAKKVRVDRKDRASLNKFIEKTRFNALRSLMSSALTTRQKRQFVRQFGFQPKTTKFDGSKTKLANTLRAWQEKQRQLFQKTADKNLFTLTGSSSVPLIIPPVIELKQGEEFAGDITVSVINIQSAIINREIDRSFDKLFGKTRFKEISTADADKIIAIQKLITTFENRIAILTPISKETFRETRSRGRIVRISFTQKANLASREISQLRPKLEDAKKQLVLLTKKTVILRESERKILGLTEEITEFANVIDVNNITAKREIEIKTKLQEASRTIENIISRSIFVSRKVMSDLQVSMQQLSLRLSGIAKDKQIQLQQSRNKAANVFRQQGQDKTNFLLDSIKNVGNTLFGIAEPIVLGLERIFLPSEEDLIERFLNEARAQQKAIVRAKAEGII